MSHEITVTTTTRLSIYLDCTCGWSARLGIEPTLSRANEVANDHLDGAKA